MTRVRAGRASRSFLVLLLAGSALPAYAAPVTSADEVCAPTDDPCVISKKVEIESAAMLDFGLREIQVTAGGSLQGVANSTIVCGGFEAVAGGTALVTPNGTMRIRAKRACSDTNREVSCFDDAGCSLGACGTHRCEGNPARACTSDASCQVGFCFNFGPSRHCTGASNVLCDTNADCDLGACGVQTTCARLDGSESVDCATNTDCGFGTCSVGEAAIAIDSNLIGRSTMAGTIDLSASDSVSVAGTMRLSGSNAESDGGRVYLRSYLGDVSLTGSIRARSGSLSTGGKISVISYGDTDINARINLTGGDFDGGTLDVEAGGNVRVRGGIRAGSNRGAGYGGIVTLIADGDVELGSEDDSEGPLRIGLDSHSAKGFAGDGGYVDIEAGGNVAIHRNVRVRANAASPFGYAGDIEVGADGDVFFAGDLQAKSSSTGVGGFLDLQSDHATIEVTADSKLDLRGGSDGGGAIYMRADGDVRFDGHANVQGSGISGTADIVSEAGKLSFGGELFSDGSTGFSPEFRMQACRVELRAGSRIENLAPMARGEIHAFESMNLMAGSEFLTPNGTSTLVYRTALKLPVVAGIVTPSPILEQNSTIRTRCSVCGNGEIDALETCDDGNVTPGDGCSDTCQVE